jgi:hypothetical protein
MPKLCKHKDCLQQVLPVPNRSKPSERVTFKNGSEARILHMYPYEDEPSGLCYYHKKKALGLIGQPNP